MESPDAAEEYDVCRLDDGGRRSTEAFSGENAPEPESPLSFDLENSCDVFFARPRPRPFFSFFSSRCGTSVSWESNSGGEGAAGGLSVSDPREDEAAKAFGVGPTTSVIIQLSSRSPPPPRELCFRECFLTLSLFSSASFRPSLNLCGCVDRFFGGGMRSLAGGCGRFASLVREDDARDECEGSDDTGESEGACDDGEFVSELCGIVAVMTRGGGSLCVVVV